MAAKLKALTGPASDKDAPAEKMPVPEDLVIASALLLAAEAASEHKDPKRPYLQGIYLHAKDGVGRVVATDGSRLFLASFGIPEGQIPSWMEDGLLLSNDGLKGRVAMIGKGPGDEVRVTYQVGMATAQLTDISRSMTFKVDRVDLPYPEYERVIPEHAFQRLDEDGNAIGTEWEPVGINSSYLKHVGDVAKTLEAGLEKRLRSKNGMIIRAFNSGGSSTKPTPLVFDFSTWPGAIFMIMPAKLSTAAIPAQTAALLAPAVKLTVRALTAHVTRNIAWAEGTENVAQKEQFLAKAKGFEVRIAEIMKRAPGVEVEALAGPEAEPKGEPEPGVMSEEDEPERDPDLGDEPAADDPEDEDGFRHAAE